MTHTFIWALGSAILVSLVSLVGIATIPMGEQRLQQATFLLISLATGALFGDAVLHLLPDTFLNTTHPVRSSFWVLAGIFSSFILEKFLRWKHEHGLLHNHAHPHTHPIKPVGKIILLSDGLHNFVDGLLIGASYIAGKQVGLATTLAVILHEIPHEMGDFGVLLDAGWPRGTALLFNFLSACVAILGLIAAFIFRIGVSDLPAIALPVTAGSFLYIAGSNLTPELHKESEPLKSLWQVLAMITGVGLMALLLLI